MSNSFGALANSTLVHDCVDDLKEDIAPLLGLALNLGTRNSQEGLIRTAAPGEVITIKDWSQPFTPYTKTAAGYVAPDYTAKSDITVTLPSAVTAVSMYITAEEYRVLIGSDRTSEPYAALRSKVNQMMLHGLQKKMAQDFLAVVTAANYTNHTVSTAGTFTRSAEIDIDTALFSRNLMDRTNAQIICSPALYAEWVKDHIAVHTYTGQPQRDRVISGGQPSSVSPFTFWRTNLTMPTDSARAFAITKSAALLVNRIPDEPTSGDADPVSLLVVEDPNGLAFLSRLWKNAQTGTIQMDLATIYGFYPLQGEALERITAA